MRIPVLLIAGLLAFGPVAHAADESGNEAPPVAVTAPPPALSPAMDESGNPVVGRLRRTRRPRFRPRPSHPRRRSRSGPAVAPRRHPRFRPRPFAPREAPPVPAPARAPEAPPVPMPSGPAEPPLAPAPRPLPAHRRRPWPLPRVPVDGLHRRRAPGPHQVHERADEEELHLRRAGPGKDHDHLPPPGDDEEAYNVFLSVLQAKGSPPSRRGTRSRSSPPGMRARHDPHRRLEGNPSAEFITRLVPLQNLESAEVVPLITPLVSKDGWSPRSALQHAAADRLARQYRPDRHDSRRGRQRGPPRDPSGLPAGLRPRDRCREDPDLRLRRGCPRGGARGRAIGVRPSRGIAVKILADARTNSVIVYAGREMQDDVADLLKRSTYPPPPAAGGSTSTTSKTRTPRRCPSPRLPLGEKRAGAAPVAAPGGRVVTPPATATGGAIVSAELEGG